MSLFASVAFLALFSSVVTGELAECTNCCESDQNIGVTSFSTNATTASPLTWSVSSLVQSQKGVEGQLQYHREFYLSTPSGLNLSEPTDFSGCGIFFVGMTERLQLEPRFTDFDNYGCDSVMQSECQRDILALARSGVDSVLNRTNGSVLTTANLRDICEAIALRFVYKKIPQSCVPANVFDLPQFGLTSGAIIAGQNLLVKPDCPVTTNSTYNSYWIDDRFILAEPGSDEAKAFRNGTTPILSIFTNLDGQPANTSSLVTPELQLSCVKTVPTEKEQEAINNDAGLSRKVSVIVPLLIALGALFSTTM